MTEIYYFGCTTAQAGHQLYSPGFRRPMLPYAVQHNLSKMLDGGFLQLHGVPDVPGQGVWFLIADYTILTWWDRSGDSRSNSNSAIVFHDPERATGWSKFVQLAQEAFPAVFARQQAMIVDTRAPGHRFIEQPAQTGARP